MRLHGNARTCPHTRLLIVERVLVERWPVAAAAGAAGVGERTAAKWVARYRSEGEDLAIRAYLGGASGGIRPDRIRK